MPLGLRPADDRRKAGGVGARTISSGSLNGGGITAIRALSFSAAQRSTAASAALRARLVAVEAEHDLIGMPGEDPHLLPGQGGAAGGDHRGDTRGVGGEHVEAALDDHGDPALAEGGAGLVQPEEGHGLVIGAGLRGVEVLGDGVAEGPAPKPSTCPRSSAMGNTRRLRKRSRPPRPARPAAATSGRRPPVPTR